MRVATRVLAVVLALTLLVGGLLVALEIVLAGLNREPWVVPHDDWYLAGLRNSWSAAPARWTFIGLTLGGSALLVLALVSRRPDTLPMGQGRQPAVVDRRSTERVIVGDVSRVDGVTRARATIGRRFTRVLAATNRTDPGDLRERIVATVDARLRRLTLAEVPAVRVRVRQTRRR